MTLPVNQIVQGDCRDVMATFPDSSIDLIVTDPPYYKVKNLPWDRQWDTADGYLEWLETIIARWYRLLKPNGSLYCFASPKMAARVEVAVGGYFNVLNNIIWTKRDMPTHALKYGDDRFRQFVQKSERIVFAEHNNADNAAKGEAGYGRKCDELRGFVFEPLRAYLDGERRRAGLSIGKIRDYMGFSGNMPHHWFAVGIKQNKLSQWQLPTAEHYQKLRECFTHLNHGGKYLRREYKYLRREYEDLRRPFSVTADVPYTDVWDFPTVQAYPGKHPCEKPAAMIEHIIRTSSREGAVVLDCFAGSGVVPQVARSLGRQFIGIEMDEHWVSVAREQVQIMHEVKFQHSTNRPDARNADTGRDRRGETKIIRPYEGAFL